MESPPKDIHQTNTEGVFDLMCGHCWDTSIHLAVPNKVNQSLPYVFEEDFIYFDPIRTKQESK